MGDLLGNVGGDIALAFIGVVGVVFLLGGLVAWLIGRIWGRGT